jgi:broad specificity phosphatase PhoE
MRLMVIRHGETSYNKEHRFTGQSDIPLSTLGECQARLLGAYLTAKHLDALVSSDLQRARATAIAIAGPCRLTVNEDSDIRELSLGKWEGMTFTEVQEREPNLLARWQANPTKYAPEGGETLVQLRTRIMCALDRWYTHYPDGTVAWVTHAGLIGVLICHLLDIDLNRRGQFHHDNASLTEFLFSSKHISLIRLNETAFLQEHTEVLSPKMLRGEYEEHVSNTNSIY